MPEPPTDVTLTVSAVPTRLVTVPVMKLAAFAALWSLTLSVASRAVSDVSIVNTFEPVPIVTLEAENSARAVEVLITALRS